MIVRRLKKIRSTVTFRRVFIRPSITGISISRRSMSPVKWDRNPQILTRAIRTMNCSKKLLLEGLKKRKKRLMSVTLMSQQGAEHHKMSHWSRITKTLICIQILILQLEMANNRRTYTSIFKITMWALKMNINNNHQQTHHLFNLVSAAAKTFQIFHLRSIITFNSTIWIFKANKSKTQIYKLKKITVIQWHKAAINSTRFHRDLSNYIKT